MTDHQSYSPSSASSAVDDADAVAAMEKRGIDSPELLLAFASPEAIIGACRWFDDKPNAGPGLLAQTIRKGGIPGYEPPRAKGDTQDDYWHSVVAWLRENFPELIDADGWPNPGATNAVVMLHYRHGKGSLTVAKHGRQIRRAAADYDRRFPLPEQRQDGAVDVVAIEGKG